MSVHFPMSIHTQNCTVSLDVSHVVSTPAVAHMPNRYFTDCWMSVHGGHGGRKAGDQGEQIRDPSIFA